MIFRVVFAFIVLFIIVVLHTLLYSGNCHHDPEWIEFKNIYNKNYSSEQEEQVAYKNFLANKRIVEIQNLKFALNLSTYTCGLNDFSDIDAETWIKLTCGFKLAPIPVIDSNLNCSSCGTNHRHITPESSPPHPEKTRKARDAAPTSLDHQKLGLTTSVKNQGKCGSCYSFAVAAAIEGQAIKHLGIRTDLSNQQIVDCSGQDTRYGNYGCEGGIPSYAFDYVRDNGGLTTFANYPYTGQVGFCYPVNPLVTVLGHRRYVKTSVPQLREILASVGPVVVAMKSLESLNPYKKGIYKDPACKNTQMNQLNHAVTLVGYGEENGVRYWKIKNSWGTGWGELGYARIAMDNDCGITLDVYAPGQ